MQSPFLVNIVKLARSPGTSRRERRQGRIQGLATSASLVPEGSEVVVDVLLEAVQGGILATGMVEASWEGECRRCLAPATGTLATRVQELYEPGGDPEVTYPLARDHIDLVPLVRDAVLLELPMAPLCRQGCMGLCPTCGGNLNELDCGCSTHNADPRWSVLDQLRDQN